MKNFVKLSFLIFFLSNGLVYAAGPVPVSGSFVIGGNEEATVKRILDGNGQIGVINSGGQLNLVDDDAIHIDGVSNTFVVNNGAILVSGTGFKGFGSMIAFMIFSISLFFYVEIISSNEKEARYRCR